ncbi:unnamed protein product [Brachionus calyciflorus]|uniref:ARID domain-containing protein n=1 Tax=Brachionus calyciflorus TaxID=104777 RepID=A0A813UYS9_9BILA|nr:unnamed protein product [Brachionus calyciflorus]
MATNASEDPPLVLEEGTEVSAKFKGAFCEAKIKKVDRIVKCKITLKTTNESQTVNDSNILNATGQKIPLNDLKQGQLVYISKTSEVNPSNLQLATLNRIIDQSVYTVVFNDGDEKCLKRSFIRFKGEKHYLDSETLNNAPLNNPEHFLYPIKSQVKQSPNSSFTESKKQNCGSDIESEAESISNTTCTSLSVKNKKEQGDRENDDEALADGEGDDDNEENISTSSSDDYPPEEKDLFVAQLYKFMDDRGTPMNKVPSINKIDIDLHKLYIIVKKFGGYNKVNKQRSWSDVCKRLGLPSLVSANVINLKSSYKRYLHPYEELHRKLGGSMLVTASSSKRSISSDSKRLFNARYLPQTNQKKSQKNQKKPSENLDQSIQENQEDALNESQEKEFTIESLVNSFQDDGNHQSQEELTLSGMVRNLNENFKKAKKEKEKEKEVKSTNKRLSNSKPKIRRISVDKASEQSKKSKSDEDEDFDDYDEEEDEEEENRVEDEVYNVEPKRKKKAKKNDDGSEESSSTSNTRISKRKSSLSKANDDESENEKKSNESFTKENSSFDQDGKKIYRSCDIELNKIVEVKYGSGKTTYHAKIVQINEENQTMMVHYLGWNNRYDEWIKINQILKVFSDDYGAYKRRKSTKPNLDYSDTRSPAQSSTKSKSSEAKNPKSGKRSSLSSISSSSSSAENKKEPQPIESKEIKVEKKSIVKMRSSDSSSSISSSSDLPITNSSNSSSISSKIKKTLSNDSNILTENDQKSIDLELEKIKNTLPENLLSIKEEIMDFEQKETDQESDLIIEESELDKLNFILSITNELIDNCFILSEQKDKKNEFEKPKSPEYKPKTFCKKDELIPVFTSEMIVSQENKFITKTLINDDLQSPKMEIDIKISVQEFKQNNEEIIKEIPILLEENIKSKPVLNESNLNTTIEVTNNNDNKNFKEKENTNFPVVNKNCNQINSDQNLPKYPFHLIGCKLVGKQKIRFIEEQMRLCREEYAKLKNEMAAIDRKKKKLKRNLLEKSASNSNTNSTAQDETTRIEFKK